MTVKGKGRVIPHKRGGVYIYVPAEVSGDTIFPFKEKHDVLVYVRGRRLIVEDLRREASYVEEAEENRREYLRVKDEMVKEHMGKVAVIAGGGVVCIADSVGEAMKIAGEKAPDARHRIVWKIGEDEKVVVRRIGGSWLRRIR